MVTNPKPKIAVISETFEMFNDFLFNMETEYRRKFIRVVEIKHVMGIEFKDHVILGDRWRIENSAMLISEINARTR